ncbi:6-carboxytetrahydropterin synthase [Algiphilus sp.]|uniref:6-pyruvoyl trahydropterin synthase family protein n=1 Tax=Algiphilus sp. TaxID=1872431 RepID=UPI0032EEF4EC
MACLFVNHLTVADFSYLDSARGLVGESWIVDIELEGDLDAQSMVLDFGAVKKRIKRAIDDSIDHTLVVPLQADGVQWEPSASTTRLLFPTAMGAIEHVAPACAVSALDCAEITAEAVARHLEAILQPLMPSSVHALRIGLRPEPIDGAYYHYTHGLRKHDGACQRIAHGHRSRLVLELDGQRQPDWEREIALAWTDIYLGVAEDISARANGRIRFAYDAPEGHFELALPEHCVDLLETDSTVECIAATLQQRLYQHKGLATTRRVRVRAFEGVDKGAIADGG